MFSLTDIAFGTKNSILSGPLSALYQSPYQTGTMRYPLDVGSYDKGHYMLFHINVQQRTAFDGIDKFSEQTALNMLMNKDILSTIRGQVSEPGTLGASIAEVQSAITGGIEKATNAVNKSINDVSSSIKGGINDLTSKLGFGNVGLGNALDKFGLGMQAGSSSPVNTSPLRTTKRTTTSIALYMPDTLVFDYSHGFETPSLADVAGGAQQLASAGKAIYDGMKSGGSTSEGLNKAAENMKPFVAEAAGGILQKFGGGDAQKLVMASAGIAKNPQLEVIYSTTNLREFQFEFMFYPRSQDEARQVMGIIEEFRFHAAPEVDSSSSGRFLIPPSEFDIEFHMNGAPNPNIPKISTCVLKSINLDYAPNGWSAYEVPGQVRAQTGGSGTPTAIRMTLSFQETQMITKEMIRRNGKTAGSARNVLEMFKPGSRENDGGY